MCCWQNPLAKLCNVLLDPVGQVMGVALNGESDMRTLNTSLILGVAGAVGGAKYLMLSPSLLEMPCAKRCMQPPPSRFDTIAGQTAWQE